MVTIVAQLSLKSMISTLSDFHFVLGDLCVRLKILILQCLQMKGKDQQWSCKQLLLATLQTASEQVNQRQQERVNVLLSNDGIHKKIKRPEFCLISIQFVQVSGEFGFPVAAGHMVSYSHSILEQHKLRVGPLSAC